MIDRGTFRAVVIGSIVLALAAIISATILTIGDREAGPAWTLATAALTAVAGLLVNPRTEADPNVDTATAAITGYRSASGDLQQLAEATGSTV